MFTIDGQKRRNPGATNRYVRRVERGHLQRSGRSQDLVGPRKAGDVVSPSDIFVFGEIHPASAAPFFGVNMTGNNGLPRAGNYHGRIYFAFADGQRGRSQMGGQPLQ